MKNKLFKLLCALDKESSRFLNMLKNIVHPLKNETIPSVTVDDDEESKALFARAYEGVSGTDTKIYLFDKGPDEEIKESEFWNHENNASFISGISFGGGSLLMPGGTIVSPVIHNMKPLHRLLGQERMLVVKAATPLGNVAILHKGMVKFGNVIEFSIDDIVIKARLNFNQLTHELDLEE